LYFYDPNEVFLIPHEIPGLVENQILMFKSQDGRKKLTKLAVKCCEALHTDK